MAIRKAGSLQIILNVAMAIETEVECLNNLRGSKKSEIPLRPHPYIRDNIRNRNEHYRVHRVEGTRNQNKTSYSPNLDQIKCYGCGQFGHYKSNCPQWSNNFSKVIGKCGFCGGPNHYEENCLAKCSFERKHGTNFENGPRKGVKEKCNQSNPQTPTPSTSKHVGSFGTSTPRK